MRAFVPALVLVLLLTTVPTVAKDAKRETVRAAAAIDGDTLELADGRTLRLAGIEAAKPPPGAEAGRRWPLAEAARALLDRLARDRDLTLSDGPPGADRYGRLRAHASFGATWLEGELLAAGLARVRTTPDDRARAPEMLTAEAAARAAGKGLWATRVYAVRPAEPEALRGDIGTFQIVAGTVRRAETHDGAVFLDFGETWRTDVSARIERSALRLFKKAGVDPLTFAGQTLRLRGWIDTGNGPLVLITHPEQVERETP